jgi:hypothetical protein
MSKLIFPVYGGVLVDNQTHVVNTFHHATRRGTYTIKVVEYPSGHRAFGYHYLDPEGGVTGSNSGNSYDAEEALQKAMKSIRDVERAARAARRSPSQKKNDRLRKKIAFFYEHGGYSTSPGQSVEEGRRESAERLARAEAFGEEAGWKVSWEPDQEEYQMGDAETEPPSEVYVAALLDANDNVLGSLGGIGDPDNNYKRLVEAELALEAMPK